MKEIELDTAEWAIRYTEGGYKTYPVNVSWVFDPKTEKWSKKPTYKNHTWKPENGAVYHTDPDEIRKQWEGFTGISLNTGLSGVVSVDIDQGEGKNGTANLKLAGLSVPQTPMGDFTPGGGFHGLFRTPAGVVIPTGQNKPVANVDIQASGGNVFVAPTVVEGYGEYRLRGDIVPVADLPLLPADWVDLLIKPDVANSVQLPDTVDELLAMVESLEDGNRWDPMKRIVPKLFGVAKATGMDLGEVADLLRIAYRGTDTDELENTIRRIGFTAEPYGGGVAQVVPDLVDVFEREGRARREATKRLDAEDAPCLTKANAVGLGDGFVSQRWLVDGMIPDGEFVILYGDSRAAKTAMMVDLAGQLAYGGSFMGQQLQPAKSLYIAAEAVLNTQNRMVAWHLQHGYRHNPAMLEVQPGDVVLDNDHSVDGLIRYINANGFKFVVIDMLEYVKGSLDFNSTGASQVVMTLKRVAAKTGATIVGLHHSKMNGDGAGKMAGFDAGFFGKSDYILYVQRLSSTFSAQMRKNKAGTDGATWSGRVISGPGGNPIYVSGGLNGPF